MKKSIYIALILSVCFSISDAQAQQSPSNVNDTEAELAEPVDEIIVEAQRSWAGHDGMDAFWAGDYEAAEIEFEREFLSLRRATSARENAAISAELNADRASSSAEFGSSGGQSTNGPGGVPVSTGPVNVDLGVGGSFSGKRSKGGRNLLNDGVTTDEDFAFTKYMSGLSELKLKKYSEAKKSLKRSVNFDGRNYDARMRLGLIHVMDEEYDKAADQLEKLDKMRVKCKKLSCPEYDEILNAASTLAKNITKNLSKQ